MHHSITPPLHSFNLCAFSQVVFSNGLNFLNDLNYLNLIHGCQPPPRAR